jgi:hypothetical protein
MARKRKLTPEQETDLYQRLRLHYHNRPRALAAEFGISIATLRTVFNRQRKFEASKP